MRKFIAISLIALMTTSCAGSRGCGCPNNLGMAPQQTPLEMPMADHSAMGPVIVWN